MRAVLIHLVSSRVSVFLIFFFFAWSKVDFSLSCFCCRDCAGGMASHEETPSLSLRNGFRCVPEDGVTVENVLISTGGEVGHENIVSASRMNQAVVVS